MNNAYKKKPYKPHVHFHVRPRYEYPVKIGDLEFRDPNFGHHYDNSKDTKNFVSGEVLQLIYTELEKHLKK